MNGDFTCYIPTKVHFGKDSMNKLGSELRNYGDNVMLCYGGGSIKENGIYDKVMDALNEAGKTVFEVPGVMSNPTYAKVLEGLEVSRANKIDLILAVGGGSVCDYAKAISVSTYCKEDPWTKYWIKFDEIDNELIPVGCVLTMVGTGSEMNGGSVITNEEQKLKIGNTFNYRLFPKFAIMNPEFTFTVPHYQMVSGIYDIFNHICEQYFSGDDDTTTDYLSEGLMRSVVASSKIAIKNPTDYEARSNLMWAASWALNSLLAMGKTEDWMVHMIGQAVGAITHAAHGMTLSAVSIPYYKMIMPYGLPKFKRFAVNVWGVNPEGKSDEEIANEGLLALENWIDEIGAVKKISELGATEDMFDDIIKGTLILKGGYKVLTPDEVRQILKESM